MAQTSVISEPVRAFEGKLQDQASRIVSGAASELIYFGKMLTRSKSVGIDGRTPIVNLFTTGEVVEGIAIADVSVERLANPTTGVSNQAPYGAFLANTAVPVLRRGRVWVVSEDTVDDLTKSVYVRNTTLAGTAATVTDTTSYPVADQDTLAYTITITDGGAGEAAGVQTVTFSVTTTTAALVASQSNTQLIGCSVSVVGGQVVWTTDVPGAGVTIAAGAGTSGLTFGTPVAGTGGPPAGAKGSFRATTASGYTDVGASYPVKWVAGQTIGGIYYGLVEINLP